MNKYNPFKMQGSYWGAFVFGAFGLKMMLIGSNFPNASPFDFIDVILTMIHVVIGFLAGWGIHSLIRHIKQKKNKNETDGEKKAE